MRWQVEVLESIKFHVKLETSWDAVLFLQNLLRILLVRHNCPHLILEMTDELITAIEVPCKLLRRFYEAVKFEDALIKATVQDPDSPGRVALDVVIGPEVDAFAAFRSFVNRLAHVCDIKKGGTTVSGVVILQDFDGAHYFVGSNNRQKGQLAELETFLRTLLHLPTLGISSTQKPRSDGFEALLLHIVKFNQPRIRYYLKTLDGGLDNCSSALSQRATRDTRDQPLDTFLRQLKEQIRFRTDERLQRDKSAFSEACVIIIKSIHDAFEDGRISEAILRHCREKQINSCRLWLELRHAIARLRAYHISAETILHSSNRWPALLRDFQITIVPSSEPLPNPLNKPAITAHEMIGRMASDASEIAARRADAERLQRFDLDDIIQAECSKESFMPLVHGEILVHDSVQKYLAENPGVRYWDDHHYVGSSKPTCRLCSYYFSHVTDVSVRESHMNLYPNWRLPDVFDPESAKKRDNILNKITQRIRMDAFNTMKNKLPQGKNNDSSSFPAVALWFKKGPVENGSISGRSTMLESVSLRTKGVTTSPLTSVGSQKAVEQVVSGVEEDDDDGGGVLLFGGRRSLIAPV